MISSSRSRQDSTQNNSETINNQVDGNGDNNTNLDFNASDGNTVNVTETDQGAISAAFDFGAMALDNATSSIGVANDFAQQALGAASDSIRDQGAVNSEKIIKTLAIAGVAVVFGLVGLKVIK